MSFVFILLILYYFISCNCSNSEHLNKFKNSVKRKEDDHTLIDYSVIKPVENDYPNWEMYWKDNCNYLQLKYQYTYGSKWRE